MNNSEKIKVIFVLPSLKAGGAERVMSYIAQNLDKQKFEATLLIIGFEKDKVYTIEGINVIYLNHKKVSQAFFDIIKTLKKIKPNIVIGSIGHINSMLSLISPLFKKIKFIGREANVGSVRSQLKSKKSTIRKLIHDRSFKVLDVIICQSQDMLNDIKKNKAVDLSKFVIINNPITDDFNAKTQNNQSKPIKYITVGALHIRKGHKRLLEVLSKVNHDFEYTIIGNGNELESIMNVAKSLNLVNQIKHVPYTKEVSKYLKQSDVFLNGSFVEGFPNVIIESCASGTPVIAFDAPGGINEIIINDVNGYIVTSEEEYIEKLNNIQKANSFNPETINASVISRYSKNVILSKYESLFESITNKSNLH